MQELVWRLKLEGNFGDGAATEVKWVGSKERAGPTLKRSVCR